MDSPIPPETKMQEGKCKKAAAVFPGDIHERQGLHWMGARQVQPRDEGVQAVHRAQAPGQERPRQRTEVATGHADGSRCSTQELRADEPPWENGLAVRATCRPRKSPGSRWSQTRWRTMGRSQVGSGPPSMCSPRARRSSSR